MIAPPARDALARGRHDAALDPADEAPERVVRVRLQKFELREVAAALAVALDVVAVLDFVEAVLGGSARGDHRVAERPRVPVDRQERVHRALEGNQRLADVAVGRDSLHALREVSFTSPHASCANPGGAAAPNAATASRRAG